MNPGSPPPPPPQPTDPARRVHFGAWQPLAPPSPSSPLPLSTRDDAAAAAKRPDNALVLLPEVEAKRPAGARRPFQHRRRGRACDACRARKTKCDSPDQGSCSACALASLVCRFSGGIENRPRVGPARRIKMLESQVAELTKKLQDAEALVGGSGGVGSSGGSGDGGSGGGGALVPGGTGSVSSSASPSPQFSSTSSTVGSHHHQHHQQHQHQHPQFVASLKDYLHRMGYHFPASSSPDYRPAAAASPQAGNGSGSCSAGPGGLGGCGNSAEQPRQPADGSPVRVPLLSELPTSNTLPVDLRMFLPPKGFAVQLSDVFRRTIQAYTPLFCWPLFLEECFERAWSRPVWREDARAVKGVFCVLQMVLAVACQMAPPESPELAEIAGGAEVQERAGWKFFRLGWKYADLNSPTYSADDVMLLLLASLYLDNASLPSPCWMTTGAMARVCQDAMLDKEPLRPHMFSEAELECRRRLFWAAYIQDRKECLKKGRAVILRHGDVEVPLPRELELEQHDEQQLAEGEEEEDDDDEEEHEEENEDDGEEEEEGGGEQRRDWAGSAGGLGAGRTGLGGSRDRRDRLSGRRRSAAAKPLSAAESLHVMTAQIHISALHSRLMAVRTTDSATDDLARIQDLDDKLKRVWDDLPAHLTDVRTTAPLDMGAIRPLFYLQYCRLLLYRFFTEPALDQDFRNFCLAHSLQISKISARLILRAARSPRFDCCFGLRTEELVHRQTLRTAVILLVCHCCSAHHEPSLQYVSRDEVDLCIRALRSIAAHHAFGRKLLAVFEDFALTLRFDCGQPHGQSPPHSDTSALDDGTVAVAAERETPSPLPPPPPQQPPPHPPLQWGPLPHHWGQDHSCAGHGRRGGGSGNGSGSESGSNTRGSHHLGSDGDGDDGSGGASGGGAHRLFGAEYEPAPPHPAPWTTDPFVGGLQPMPPHDMTPGQCERSMSVGDPRLGWADLYHPLQFDAAGGASGPPPPLHPHPHPHHPEHHPPHPPPQRSHHGQPPQPPSPPSHLQQPQHGFWDWNA